MAKHHLLTVVEFTNKINVAIQEGIDPASADASDTTDFLSLLSEATWYFPESRSVVDMQTVATGWQQISILKYTLTGLGESLNTYLLSQRASTLSSFSTCKRSSMQRTA